MALRTLIIWYFPLDYYNYSQWLTVNLFDLVNLEQQLTDVYENFCKGYFSFNKSCSEFSTMALDQLHEETIEIIKGVNGVTRLLNREEEAALLRWEHCRSEIVKRSPVFKKVLTQLHL